MSRLPNASNKYKAITCTIMYSIKNLLIFILYKDVGIFKRKDYDLELLLYCTCLDNPTNFVLGF